MIKKLKNKDIDILTSLLQLSIKKGKKTNSEKVVRQTLFYLSQNNKNLDLIEFFKQVQMNIQPAVKLQKKKNNYKPAYANDWYKKTQASTWILNEVKKNKNKFYKALALELLALNNDTSAATKHRLTLYQTAMQNTNIKFS